MSSYLHTVSGVSTSPAAASRCCTGQNQSVPKQEARPDVVPSQIEVITSASLQEAFALFCGEQKGEISDLNTTRRDLPAHLALCNNFPRPENAPNTPRYRFESD